MRSTDNESPGRSAPGTTEDPQGSRGSTLAAVDRQRLLEIARASIAHGLEHQAPLPIRPAEERPGLRAQRASFVTLHLDQSLRGCIGLLKARTALAEDVSQHAYAAAFEDPRFPPLRRDEFAPLHIEVSVLTEPEPMAFTSEAELLAAIEPHRDGLILSEGAHQGTFLPSVWAQLPNREAFLQHLKRKAGLAPDHWSDQIRVSRYQTESFAE
jgi:AmmeMemoRadiSam system protein A